MVEFSVPWVQSRDFRIVSATGATVGGIATVGEGNRIIIRFTFEWAHILKETFSAEVAPLTEGVGGTGVTGTGPTTFQFSDPVKIEEVAVKLPPDVAGGLIVALLENAQFYSEPVKQVIRDTVARTLAK